MITAGLHDAYKMETCITIHLRLLYRSWLQATMYELSRTEQPLFCVRPPANLSSLVLSYGHSVLLPEGCISTLLKELYDPRKVEGHAVDATSAPLFSGSRKVWGLLSLAGIIKLASKSRRE